MRFILDEMYSDEIANQLRRRGFDVIAVVERSEFRTLDDEELLRQCTHEGRVMVTENREDFARIHHRLITKGENHQGIVIAAVKHFPNGPAKIGRLVRALSKLMVSMPDEQALRDTLHWLQP